MLECMYVCVCDKVKCFLDKKHKRRKFKKQKKKKKKKWKWKKCYKKNKFICLQVLQAKKRNKTRKSVKQ